MKKFTICLKLMLFSAAITILMAFSAHDLLDQYIGFLQKSLNAHYDAQQDGKKVKRYELNVTNNGFCRYKRYYSNGKTEYFSFKLAKFKDLDYYGDANVGQLYLYTKGEDVIVQTYNDKFGDVDSMATKLTIPLKNIEPEDLNAIKENLMQIVKLPSNP